MKQILILIFLITTISASAIRPEKKYVVTPEVFGLMYKDLKVRTSDGYRIKTWFIPAQKLLSVEEVKSLQSSKKRREYILKDKKRKPTIIICDGDSGNMSYQLYAATSWAQKGFNVVLFDWRGFGESSEFKINRDNLFYEEFLIDYLAVIEEVNVQAEVKKDNIVLFGFSTGAYFSFAAAYKNPHIKALVLRGLITNFEEAIVNLERLKPGTKARLIIPKNYNRSLCPINIVSDFKKPCLLIVGEKDGITPAVMSKKIFNNLDCEKELWITKGAAHGGSRAPEVVKREEFINKSSSFFKRNSI